MMNKLKLLAFWALIIAIVIYGCSCSDNVSGGFGSETSNGMVSTIWIIDSTKNYASGAFIELIPAGFNALVDNDSLIKNEVTGDSGRATFKNVPFGEYNLIALSSDGNKNALYFNLVINSDSTYLITDTLQNSGTTKLLFKQLPAKQEFACYIPGTKFAAPFSEAQVNSNGEYILTFSNMPVSDNLTFIGYQKSTDEKFLITDSSYVESDSESSQLVPLVWSAYKYDDNSDSILNITSVVNDSMGNTWFSQTGMIIKVDTLGNATYFDSDDIGMSIFPIRNSILDSAGFPLFSTSNGIIKFDGTVWSRWDIFPGEFTFQNILLKNYNRKTNTYWFSSNTGIRSWNSDTTFMFSSAITTDNDTISLLDVTSISSTIDGDLWVGTRFNGVLINRGDTWTKLEEVLPSQGVNDVVTYDDGRIIISTLEGVLYNTGFEWKTFGNGNSLLANCQRASFAKNSLWVISENNLYKYNGSVWSNFNEENSMVKSSKVTFLTIDEVRNRGYLGTKMGILVFDYI